MKTSCPVCKTEIELDTNEYDEGDTIECDECGEELEVEIRNGSYRLVTSNEKKYKEMEELDESFDYED